MNCCSYKGATWKLHLTYTVRGRPHPHFDRSGRKVATKPWAGEQEVYKIQAQGVEEDFIPVASIRSVGLKRSKSTS